MPKRNVYDTTILFKDNDLPPLDKAGKMLQSLKEYTLTTEAICGLLLCNRKYIDDYIKPNVANIFIDAKQMKWISATLNLEQSFLNSHKSYYYFSKDSFVKYVQDIIICTRQTICVDLMNYMKDEVKEGTEIYKTAIGHINRGELEQAKDYLNPIGRLLYSKALSKVYSTKRKLTSIIEVENQIKFEDFPLLRAGSNNNETFYRHAFMNGYIKAKLNGKSFFIKTLKNVNNWGITLSYEEYCNICY